MDYLLGTAIGGLTAFVLAGPTILFEQVEHWRKRETGVTLEVKTMWGRKLEKHEVFLVALLIHVVIGALFGLVYVLFVKKGWLVFTHSPYTFLSLAIFAFCSWIVAGTVVFPALGLGLFGRKEGKRVWMEMLVTHFVLGIGMWLLVKYYQPVWFVG
ncbi:DUF2938 family protein [bacterium]|nr:DUF2938 family protein [bacterium]